MVALGKPRHDLFVVLIGLWRINVNRVAGLVLAQIAQLVKGVAECARAKNQNLAITVTDGFAECAACANEVFGSSGLANRHADPTLVVYSATEVVPEVGCGIEDRQVRVANRRDPGAVLFVVVGNRVS